LFAFSSSQKSGRRRPHPAQEDPSTGRESHTRPAHAVTPHRQGNRRINLRKLGSWYSLRAA
jgi:hypothetical protein